MPAYRPSARPSKRSFAYNPQTSPKCYKYIYIYIYIYIYRGAKTLKDNLIHSKLPSLNDNSNKNLSTLNQYGGCQPCEKRCLLCKNYFLKQIKLIVIRQILNIKLKILFIVIL